MKEFKSILEAYKQVDFSERKVALATVMQVKGSSYRSPGARMLMMDNGHWVGSVSGGCLEGDALRKARSVMADKTPRTVTYDTADDQSLGIGLGCEGIIDILLEPIDPSAEGNPIQLIESFLEMENTGALATVFESTGVLPVGSRVLLKPDGLVEGENAPLNEILEATLSTTIENQKSTIEDFEFDREKIKVFFEVIQPRIDLLIFGGGFDAKPVTELANVLGWNVRVSDECIAHLVPINFPNAQLVSCQKEFVKSQVKITPFTAVVLMSHNYEYDKGVLAQIIDSDAAYIGLLGPKKRADRLIKWLADEHKVELTKDQKDKLHYPIGLDIGAETPDEIAVSIIAEIQAKFSNRSGGLLKYRSDAIHPRDGKDDQVFRQVYLKHVFEKRKTK